MADLITRRRVIVGGAAGLGALALAPSAADATSFSGLVDDATVQGDILNLHITNPAETEGRFILIQGRHELVNAVVPPQGTLALPKVTAVGKVRIVRDAPLSFTFYTYNADKDLEVFEAATERRLETHVVTPFRYVETRGRRRVEGMAVLDSMYMQNTTDSTQMFALSDDNQKIGSYFIGPLQYARIDFVANDITPLRLRGTLHIDYPLQDAPWRIWGSDHDGAVMLLTSTQKES